MSKRPVSIQDVLARKAAQKQRTRASVQPEVVAPISPKLEAVKPPTEAKKAPWVEEMYSEKSDLKADTRFKFINQHAVEDSEILLQFLDWIALPKTERVPSTQQEFAENHGIHYNTLTTWKNLRGFWDDVKLRRAVYFREFASDVYFGLVQRARKGTAREVELFAKLFEGYSEKVRVQDETPPNELTDEQREQIHNAMRLAGLATVRERHAEREKEFLASE